MKIEAFSAGADVLCDYSVDKVAVGAVAYREHVPVVHEIELSLVLCAGEALIYLLLHLLDGQPGAEHLCQRVERLLRHFNDVVVKYDVLVAEEAVGGVSGLAGAVPAPHDDV